MRDYGRPQAATKISLNEYQEVLSNGNNLEENDVYRYPKCRKFSPKPSDSGICHTFNGLELNKILKPSTWTDAFLSAFGGHDSGTILKSEGIDLHDGFIFSLDTLQSYLIGMNKRSPGQRHVNTFYIKVHPAGEIPWITQDKSSWKKISPYTNEMSTRFITLKGEKIEGKVNFKKTEHLMEIKLPIFRIPLRIFRKCCENAAFLMRVN